MHYVDSFNITGIDVKQTPCILGKGAPTLTTEGAVGCLYMDEDSGNLYKCLSTLNGFVWEDVSKVADNTATLVINFSDENSKIDKTFEEISEAIGQNRIIIGQSEDAGTIYFTDVDILSDTEISLLGYCTSATVSIKLSFADTPSVLQFKMSILLDESNLGGVYETIGQKADTTYVDESIQSAIFDSWEVPV